MSGGAESQIFDLSRDSLPEADLDSLRESRLAVDRVRARLFELRDEPYQAFSAKLMPTLDSFQVIGVRTPALRKYARELARTEDGAEFMAALPHKYFEENNLHGFMIETIRDYDACVAALDAFLPYVDNWATCDQTSPKVLGKYPEKLRAQVDLWLQSKHVYTIRYGIGTLLRWFLDAHFDPADLAQVAAIRSEEYYVNMMIAWYFAEALAKQYDAALPYVVNRRLADWTHNKAIQKAWESYRISPEQKEYLKNLKVSSRKRS